MMSNLGGPEIPTGTSSFGFFDRRGWQFEQQAPLAAEGGFVKEIWATADPEFPDNQTIGFRFIKVWFWSAVDSGHVALVVAFPGGGSEVVEPFDLFGAQLDGVGGGVLLDAGDPLCAGDRGDVVALGE